VYLDAPINEAIKLPAIDACSLLDLADGDPRGVQLNGSTTHLEFLAPTGGQSRYVNLRPPGDNQVGQ
jgi:hypothetical protein